MQRAPRRKCRALTNAEADAPRVLNNKNNNNKSSVLALSQSPKCLHRTRTAQVQVSKVCGHAGCPLRLAEPPIGCVGATRSQFRSAFVHPIQVRWHRTQNA